MTLDLGPAADRLAALVAAVDDDELGAPTPCPAMSLGDLLDHVGGLAVAFTAAATKDLGERTDTPPGASSAANLEPGWRERIARDLVALATAWRDPEAWTGMTRAGGVDLPGDVAGLVAVDELVVHGWDVAVASGQAYDPEPELVAAARAFADGFEAGDDDGLFGPPVAVPADAPPLHQLLGRTGRDPGWRPDR